MTATVRSKNLLPNRVPAAGKVVYTVNTEKQVIRDPAGNVVFQGPLTIKLIDGETEVELPASDDLTLQPSGFTFTATEQLDHVSKSNYRRVEFQTVDGEVRYLADYADGDEIALDPSYGANLNGVLASVQALRAGTDPTFQVALAASIDDHTYTGVGYDVVAIWGQSNAVGSGETGPDTTYLDPRDGRIFMWPGSGAYMGQIVGAIDPLPHYFGSFSTGPGMPFGREYVKRVPPNRPLLLVPAGRGATGFTVRSDGGTTYSWDPADTTANVNLYNFAVAQIDTTLAAAGDGARLAGVIWVQGENDEGFLNQAQYAAKLDSLIDAVRARYGAEVPFVIGQMLPEGIDATGANAAAINAAHVDTPRRKTRTAFAYGARGYAKTEVGGPIHYTNAGQRIQGKRIAEALFKRALTNVTGTAPVPVVGLTLTQSGTSVTATWNQPAGRVTSYTVRKRVNGGAWSTITRTYPMEVSETVTGLTLGDTLSIEVTAVNEDGTGTPVTGSLTLVTLPAQTTGLTLGTPGPTSQPLSWTAAARADRYRVEYKKTADSTWLLFGTVTGTSTVVNGLLSPNVSHDYRVTSVNAAGDGTVSATSTGTTAPLATLDSVVGTTAARGWSVRKLRAGYSGPCMKVRRSSDSALADIGFTASGDLDQTALLAHVGAGDGFVHTWFDQFGSANQVQATASRQPKIAVGGVVQKANGIPAPKWDGGDDILVGSAGVNYTLGATILAVAETTAQAFEQDVYAEFGSPARYAPFVQSGGSMGRGLVGFNDAAVNIGSAGTAPAFPTGLSQMSFADYGTQVKSFTNGVNSSAGTTIATRGAATMTNSAMGQRSTAPVTGQSGGISEVVVWYGSAALDDTHRQLGEANQKAYYATP